MIDHVFTLGIEEEFQIIDPETRELRSHIQEIIAGGKMILKERSSRRCISPSSSWAQRFAVMGRVRASKSSNSAASWRWWRRAMD
jgi:hypothetical protein